jgi:hypothetical protein
MVHKPIIISVIAPMTVAGILIMAILANQAFAQEASNNGTTQQEEKPTSLSLDASPNKGKVGPAGYLVITLSGKLTSEGSPVDGATIHLLFETLTTNKFGAYSTLTDIAPGTHKIKAYFPGDATHESSSATTVVTVTR